MNTEAVERDSRGVVTLRELYSAGNFFAHTFERWQQLGKSLFAVKDADADNLFGEYLEASLHAALANGHRKKIGRDKLVKIFREKLMVVEKDTTDHLLMFMPEAGNEFQRLERDLQANAMEENPVELIRRVSALKDNRPITPVEFRDLRALEMAAFYFYITATRYEMTDPEETKDEDTVRRFLQWLDPFHVAFEDELLEIGLDPSKQWKLASYRLPGFQMPNFRRTDLRIISKKVMRVSFKNKLITAIVESRRKALFEAFAKRFRDLQSPLWPDVSDLFGIRLIYSGNRTMKFGLQAVSHRAIFNNNPRVHYCHTSNKHSQKKMRIKNQRVLVNGRQSEIQHTRIEDWINIGYSTAPENHSRYHLRWYTDEHGVFQNLFPPALFGLDWTSEEVRKTLHGYVINRVKEENERISKIQA